MPALPTHALWAFEHRRHSLLAAACCEFAFSAVWANPGWAQSPPAPTFSRQVATTCPNSGYQDGCDPALRGTTMLPALLSGYRFRPPWNVAGADFPVGLPAGLELKDAATAALPSGCSMSGSTVNCSGSVTIDGYDFSQHGGISLIIKDGEVTVQNCLFTVGTNQGALGRIIDVSGSTNASFLHNEVDGANISVSPQRGQAINLSNTGAVTFKYNYLHHSGGDMIDFSGGPQTEIVQSNLFKDIGFKTAHSDTLQWCGSVVRSSDIGFNTIVQTAAGLSGMGLLTINAECTGANMSHMLVHNNTLISKARDNFATGANVTQDAGPAAGDHVAVFDNYTDPSGIMRFTGSPWFPTGYYHGTLPRPSTYHSLIDMRTGRPIALSIRSERIGRSGYFVYPDDAGYTPASSDVYGVTAIPSSGALSVGGTIMFTLHMDQAWNVKGEPTLSLNSGGRAKYLSGSGTHVLTFSYTIQSGETAEALAITSVNFENSQIKDAYGNSANMSGAIGAFVQLSVR
jgi:hypothetical protein